MVNSLCQKSAQIFLSQIIDYAGLYPPASLPLEEAFFNFVKYQNDPEAWMLSRFIIPAKRLAELSLLGGWKFGGVLCFSALGRGGKEPVEFLENLQLDIIDIQKFRELHENHVMVDMFEVALPSSVLIDLPSAHDLINKASEMLNLNGISVFFEAPFGEGWHDRAEKTLRSLRKLKDKHVGFKLRTGGVTAEAFPSLEQVAWAIVAARDAGVFLKATAGLHHPVRHYNDSVFTKMHGFLNVFGAGILALTNNLSLEQTQLILADEDAKNFVFDESGFAWKNIHASNEQIAQARQRVISFGSCSFEEPREDLKKLGLLLENK